MSVKQTETKGEGCVLPGVCGIPISRCPKAFYGVCTCLIVHEAHASLGSFASQPLNELGGQALAFCDLQITRRARNSAGDWADTMGVRCYPRCGVIPLRDCWFRGGCLVTSLRRSCCSFSMSSVPAAPPAPSPMLPTAGEMTWRGLFTLSCAGRIPPPEAVRGVPPAHAARNVREGQDPSRLTTHCAMGLSRCMPTL